MRPGVPLIWVAGVIGLSLLAAGCGGSSGSGTKVAQIGSTQTTTTSAGLSGSSKREALVAFSACMRKNGVPKFPDPQVVGSGMRLSIGSESGIDVKSPQFKKAEQTCRKLLPNGGRQTPQEQAKQLQQALDYAACMRKHGVAKFPDPKPEAGGIAWESLGRVGVDQNSPQFKAAQRTCRKLVPGSAGIAPD
jgi:hypothetical protein